MRVPHVWPEKLSRSLALSLAVSLGPLAVLLISRAARRQLLALCLPRRFLLSSVVVVVVVVIEQFIAAGARRFSGAFFLLFLLLGAEGKLRVFEFLEKMNVPWGEGFFTVVARCDLTGKERGSGLADGLAVVINLWTGDRRERWEMYGVCHFLMVDYWNFLD